MTIAKWGFGKWHIFAQLNHALNLDSNPSHEMFFFTFKSVTGNLSEIWNVDIWETDPPQLKSSDELNNVPSLRFLEL